MWRWKTARCRSPSARDPVGTGRRRPPFDRPRPVLTARLPGSGLAKRSDSPPDPGQGASDRGRRRDIRGRCPSGPCVRSIEDTGQRAPGRCRYCKAVPNRHVRHRRAGGGDLAADSMINPPATTTACGTPPTEQASPASRSGPPIIGARADQAGSGFNTLWPRMTIATGRYGRGGICAAPRGVAKPAAVARGRPQRKACRGLPPGGNLRRHHPRLHPTGAIRTGTARPACGNGGRSEITRWPAPALIAGRRVGNARRNRKRITAAITA